MKLSRRSLLVGAGALALAPHGLLASDGVRTFRLSAKPGSADLIGANHPSTPVWAYNGTVPGPEIRVRQGDHVRIVVDNQLSEGTTVHWHGLRVPIAMDGVPGLTQSLIDSGASFAYEFDVPDAGTVWYH